LNIKKLISRWSFVEEYSKYTNKKHEFNPKTIEIEIRLDALKGEN